MPDVSPLVHLRLDDMAALLRTGVICRLSLARSSGYTHAASIPAIRVTALKQDNRVFGQLIRYAVSGASAASVYSLVYLLVADRLLPPGEAVFAVIPAFLVSLYISFQLHSHWSFAGHGSRDEKVTQRLRFFVVQAAGLIANVMVTYVVTVLLDQPNWVALIPCLTLTPLLTFALQRQWVFS